MQTAEKIQPPTSGPGAKLVKRMRKRPGHRSAEASGTFPDIVAAIAERLTKRQLTGASMMVRDLQAEWGNSGGIVGRYAERVQTSVVNRGVMMGWRLAADRFEGLNRHLSDTEHKLLRFLVMNAEYPRRRLADYGRTMTHFADDHACHAYAVGLVAALLDRVADHYRVPPPP